MAEWMMYRYINGPSIRPKPTSTDAARQWDFTTTDALGRIISGASSSNASAPGQSMDATRGSISSSSIQSTKEESVGTSTPFVLRHGRRYLRDVPYPLPCDLPELQRQNLHTLLSTSAFGRALGSTPSLKQPPKKVLEIACGSGYWSSLCHDYLEGLGYTDVSFTGLDVVHLAGDLRKQGINWRFVQHDLRRIPLPFDDAEFDLVVMKDLSLVVPLGSLSQQILDECIRILKKGGILEIWETDHIIRSLLPHPPHPPGKNNEDYDCAVSTGTFLIEPGTPFTAVQNKYLQDSNSWIQEALDKRKLTPTPCTRVTQILLQEPEALCDVGYRRVAIPLGELRWEREATAGRNPTKRRESEPVKGKRNITETPILTEDQAALRYTALLVVIQMIESLEPLILSFLYWSSKGRWWSTERRSLLGLSISLAYGAVLFQVIQCLNFFLYELCPLDAFLDLLLVFETCLTCKSLVKPWSEVVIA